MRNACAVAEPKGHPMEFEGAPAPHGGLEGGASPSGGRRLVATAAPLGWSLLGLSGLATLLAVLFMLSQFGRLVQLQYALAEKSGALSELQRTQARLQLDLEQLTSLEQIERQAGRMGMIHPPTRQVLELPEVAGPVGVERVAVAGASAAVGWGGR